jgi:hypothetical protein
MILTTSVVDTFIDVPFLPVWSFKIINKTRISSGLKFLEKDMIFYQYHFFDKDIRYDIISNLRPRYRYDIISSKKRYFQCLVLL